MARARPGTPADGHDGRGDDGRGDAGRGDDGRRQERERLHRPFAPRRARAVAWVVAVLAVVGALLLTVLVPDVAAGDRVGFLVVGALVAAFMARQAGVRAVPDEEGLAVRNLFLSRRLAWAEVVEVRLGDGQPWVQLDLSDGDVLAVMAVQRADGASADAEARRLATLVALHSPRG
ncbi:PH domain-containing protein [Pseudokineococcus basanitobsidens]|uniref:PH domain-containing protein n=1 Tax=Pseudokineococcus basanitobsidens TaxID=1926649 RepID=A0ABU8RI54_9ACTN